MQHPYRDRADDSAKSPPSRAGWLVPIAQLTVLAVVVFGVCSLLQAPVQGARRWTFTESSTPDELGLQVENAEAGAWSLEHDAHATGARALVNHSGQDGSEPAVAIVRQSSIRDALSVTRCKSSRDHALQSCGLVARYQDANNYYVARVDTAKQKVVLAVKRAADEREIASVDADIDASSWQELALRTEQDRIVVYWNGRRVIDAFDKTLRDSGAVGLWAPAKAVAHFDDLAVHPLRPGADSELIPLLSHDG